MTWCCCCLARRADNCSPNASLLYSLRLSQSTTRITVLSWTRRTSSIGRETGGAMSAILWGSCSPERLLLCDSGGGQGEAFHGGKVQVGENIVKQLTDLSSYWRRRPFDCSI